MMIYGDSRSESPGLDHSHINVAIKPLLAPIYVKTAWKWCEKPHKYPHNCQMRENSHKLPPLPPIWKLRCKMLQKWRKKAPVCPHNCRMCWKSHKIPQVTPPSPHLEMWAENDAKTAQKGPHYAPQLSDCVKIDDYSKKYSAIKFHKNDAHKRPPFPPQLSDLCKSGAKSSHFEA